MGRGKQAGQGRRLEGHQAGGRLTSPNQQHRGQAGRLLTRSPEQEVIRVGWPLRHGKQEFCPLPRPEHRQGTGRKWLEDTLCTHLETLDAQGLAAGAGEDPPSGPGDTLGPGAGDSSP